ncbi:site-specific integrase [Sphingopyxis sp. GW247-27LB]|uniref:tyrosine-type recombinase/integrase n=1 Tax=Sphingopyxis sp. GW247-27LB TaxID=2012632 RepID=UPI001C3EF615|nr:site-specific integrase [Sphingopyxis sp. GW247-27LB]
MPFILRDDGSYDHHLNHFLRSCPTMGVRSLNSLRAYARDIVVWMRFLGEQRNGKSLWQADRDDVAAFHRARRLSEPPYRISAASWNRAVAALDKLYRWGRDEKLIVDLPFTYRQSWIRSVPDGALQAVSANCAREPGARRGDMRFVDLDRYMLFRDVGLRGRLPDEREDPDWRGRHGERNALFAELLITTGLRLQEASSLLLSELPNHRLDDPSIRSLPYRLAAATAKGGRGREIRLPARLLKQLGDYARVERENAVCQQRVGDAKRSIVRPILATPAGRRSLRIIDGDRGTSVSVDRLSPAERARLVDANTLEPLALWLTETGGPMTMPAWEAVFMRASARCQAFGLEIDVTPHMLRHGFAVHMLALLLREQVAWVIGGGAGKAGSAYRRLIGDPLLKLQRLMGHSRIESTYIYLDHLDESQAIVDAAVDQWGLDLAPDDAA